MFYVAARTRERIVTAEVRKLEARRAAERARRPARDGEHGDDRLEVRVRRPRGSSPVV